VAAAFRVVLALITPPLYAPDEAGHLLYVHQIATKLSFPVQSLNAVWADKAGANEFYQPPLYYLLVAPLYRLLMGWGEAAVYGLRLLNVALSVAGIYVIYRIAGVVFPERPGVQVGAASVVALLPTLAGMGSSVNCDNLSCLIIFTTTLLLLQRLRDGSVTWKQALAIGGLTAAALYVKTSAIVLLPSIGLWAVFLERRGCRCLLKASMAAGMALLAILPWWLGRNLASYGDLLGVDIGWAHFLGGPLQGVARAIAVLTYTFWIAFGRIYDVASGNPLAILLTMASLLLTWRAIRLWMRGGLTAVQVSMAAILTLQFGLALAAAVNYAVRYGFSEGRYIYPALPAVALTLAFAACSWRPSNSTWTARATLAVMGTISVGLLVFALVPAYRNVTVDATVGGPMYPGHTGNYVTWVKERQAPIR
jgi:4-amino-4-deoxy-L-arabinose transferase-like glycosyltransferase